MFLPTGSLGLSASLLDYDEQDDRHRLLARLALVLEISGGPKNSLAFCKEFGARGRPRRGLRPRHLCLTPPPAGPRPGIFFLTPPPAGPSPRLKFQAPPPAGPSPRLKPQAPPPAGRRPRRPRICIRSFFENALFFQVPPPPPEKS